MAKYISKDFHKFFSKLIPELPRKISNMELWDFVCTKLEIEAELIVDKTDATLTFDFKNKTYSVKMPRNEVLIVEKNGDVTDKRYDIMIPLALEAIIELKPWKKSKKNKKEKAV